MFHCRQLFRESEYFRRGGGVVEQVVDSAGEEGGAGGAGVGRTIF